MQLSTKTRYAVRLLVRMAQEPVGRVWRKQELARAEDIPVDYVAQILLILKRSGIVGSQRGMMGGFVLGVDPRGLTVAQVLENTDGPVALVPCGQRGKVCQRSEECVVQEVWHQAGRVLKEYLSGITIGQLAREVAGRKTRSGLSFEI